MHCMGISVVGRGCFCISVVCSTGYTQLLPRGAASRRIETHARVREMQAAPVRTAQITVQSSHPCSHTVFSPLSELETSSAKDIEEWTRGLETKLSAEQQSNSSMVAQLGVMQSRLELAERQVRASSLRIPLARIVWCLRYS